MMGRRDHVTSHVILFKERLMSPLRLLVFALGTLVAVNGCTSAPAPAAVDTAADESTLKEATQTWLKAYNAGDADTIAGLYAEDAVLMPPHAPVVTGKTAIREFIAKDSAGARAAGVKLVPGAATAGVNGDMGWESGSYTITDASGQTIDSGSYLSVSRKINGKWLLVRDTYNSDRPLPTPPAAPEKKG
jgi:uncharacterized protein (TIGR02246 family)